MLTDELFGEGEKKSLTDQLFAEPKSLTDQLTEEEVKVEVPEADLPMFESELNRLVSAGEKHTDALIKARDFVTQTKSKVGDIAKGLKPESIRENFPETTIQHRYMKELMAPSVEEFDRLKSNPILSEQFKKEFVDTSIELGKLVQQPYDVAKGLAEFFIHGVSSTMLGILNAGRRGYEKIPYLLTGGSLLDIYKAMETGFKEAMEFVEPARLQLEESLEAPRELIKSLTGKKVTDTILGAKERVKPELVGAVGMAPATAIMAMKHGIAEWFDNKDIKGAIEISGDVVALVALGRMYHGGSKKLLTDTQKITEKAAEVVKQQNLVNEISDPAIKSAQQKILDMQKNQLEMEAKALQDNLDYGKMIKEDLTRKGKHIAQIKQAKKYIADEAINKALEKIPEEKVKEPKVKKEKTTKVVEEEPTIELQPETFSREKALSELGEEMVQDIEAELGKPIEKTTKAELEELMKEWEKDEATDLDYETGTREPEQLGTHQSPFREPDSQITADQRKMFGEKRVFDSPETIVAKWTNDVNSFLDGVEGIDIEKVRNSLSDFAVAARDPGNRGQLLDYFEGDSNAVQNFVEMAGEAASWARRAERGEPGVQLNMMIPIDKVPQAVKDVLRSTKVLAKDIFRNEEIWRKTGFWYGRDGKWRKELKESEFDIKPLAKSSEYEKAPLWEERLGDIVDYPELFKEFPKAEKIWIRRDKSYASDEGTYDPISWTMIVGSMDKKTISHELQHAIDSISGSKFKGSNIQEGYFKYAIEPGEIEARLAEARMNMSPAERAKTPPWETLDTMLGWEKFTTDMRISKKHGQNLYDIGGAIFESAKEVASRIKRVHPATYPKVTQKTLADILNTLGVSDVLDIFGGIGKIGLVKNYGYKGKVSANEIEPSWRGVPTEKLQRENKVDVSTIGDSRNLNIPDNSVGAIVTSPTYGNLMGLRSPSKKDSYTAFAGGRLQEGNTGGEVWGPNYEKLHREVYDEAFRVVKPGGYFILNMKDKPVTAADQKNNWIPKRGSTVKVENGVMKATDWHIKALEEVGFEFINRMKIQEPKQSIDTQRFAKTVGYEEVVVMGKPKVARGGTTLFDIGGATAEGAKQIVEMAKNYANAFKRDMESKKKMSSPSFKRGSRRAAEALWDTKTYARKMLLKGQKEGKLGEEANYVLQKLINESGGHAYGQTLFEQFRKEVYGGLTEDRTRVLNSLIRGKRIIDIAGYKQGARFPKHQGSGEAISYTELFSSIEKIPQEEAANLLRRRDAYFEWMNKLVDVREAEGIITKELADGLRKHDYAKFKGIGQRLEEGEGGSVESLFDEVEKINIGGRIRSVNSSGIDTLSKGKLTDILDPDQQLTALEIFNRVYGQVFRNRVFQELANLARKNPSNPIARLGRKEAHPDQPKLGDVRNWTRYNFREGGERKAVFIDTEFAKGLETVGRDMSTRAIAWSNAFSLSNVARMSLTGAAPLWSLFVNMPRDILHTYFAAGTYTEGKFNPVYSSFPPRFVTQLGRDYAATFYDTFFRAHNQPERVKFMKAAEHGLLMPFLATQAKLSSAGYKLPGKMAALEKFFTYVPESLELWTRQAIVERVLRREAKSAGVTVEEARNNNRMMNKAVMTARDYLDFSQGGWWIKMQDQAGKIYLNAGVQAARTFARTFKENPQQAILRVVQTVGIPTVMLTAASKMYAPKTSKDIPKYQDDLNMNIPFPDSMRFTDKTGQEVGLYLSIPLDSSGAFLKNVFQGLTEKFMYESGLTTEEPNYESILGALTKTAPDIMSLPPSQRAAIQYMLNIDFWTRRHITSEQFSYPKSAAEYKKGETSELAIDVGQATGLSPDRLESVKRAILGNNVWTYAIGAGYDKVFGDVPKEMKEEHLALQLAQIPGISRFIKVARGGTGFSDKQKEIIEEETFRDFVNSRNVDFYAKAYYWYGADEAQKDLMKYIYDPNNVKDRNESDKLKDRMKFIANIKELPDRNSWLRMWNRSAEEKAEDFVNRLNATDEAGRKEIWSKAYPVLVRAGGYVTPEFRSEVGKKMVK